MECLWGWFVINEYLDALDVASSLISLMAGSSHVLVAPHQSIVIWLNVQSVDMNFQLEDSLRLTQT